MRFINGFLELMNSPSGVFALLALPVSAVLCWHLASVVPFTTLIGIVGSWLAYTESNEEIQKINKSK